MPFRLSLLVALCALAPVVSAQTAVQDLGISSHVLDIARGVGGGGVPVMLEVQTGDGWALLGRAVSQDNGRVESFTADESAPRVSGTETYRLTFDLSDYWDDEMADDDGPSLPFFPEVVVVFRTDDPTAHTHVPVLVSPFGYSTYRGN
ncbi:hydroxyisourate hydrolase [Rubrivirga litoralis]|uniref:5-hydroxyisourate hydrolase n=1 Tax=Rubrivirga litoralis TaxID=3075598 RepID=A0ABU3BNI3_9BACT|nr:hydroxyisourate hydrolase [Rubrivirga sp. F394]MDT0630828.1 hydroxyisourate hydrolase [Rubrivirga sp. F394]